MNQAFDIPLLFIVFSRPDTTALVFEEIRKLKPAKLFIFCDGERANKLNDSSLIAATKKVVEKVDWECEVHRNYKTENLGCGKGPQAAIDWFFLHQDKGIILEDDCVPSPTFFRFCKEMLIKYENNPDIMHISGVNFQDGNRRGNKDYYFSKHQHCWGWATWKRAWDRFDFKMADYPEFLKENRFRYVSRKSQIKEYWKRMMEEVYDNEFTDIWDYQWSYAIWKHKGLCITPNVNLISNIGFGPNATHTQWAEDITFNRPRFDLNFPLTHPGKIKSDLEGDLYFNIFYKVYIPVTFKDRIEQLKKFFNPKQNPISVKIYQKLKPYIRPS